MLMSKSQCHQQTKIFGEQDERLYMGEEGERGEVKWMEDFVLKI